MINKSTNLFITDEEFDIFVEKYQNQRTQYLESVRKEIQEKLLELNMSILEEIKNNKLQLFNHANPSNITSLIFPCCYNRGKVNWLGVRYGKHPADIKDLNKRMTFGHKTYRDDKDPKYTFQKHACMQVNVGYSGIDIGIFHAVPDGAVDRLYLHEHINKNDTELLNQIVNEIQNLKGYGFEWNIWDTNLEGTELPNFGGMNYPEKIYKFDIENTEDFLTWYNKNDRDGCYSSMLVHFPRYDERINKDNIVKTIIDIFTQLYPLYKLLSWNIHYTGKVEI